MSFDPEMKSELYRSGITAAVAGVFSDYLLSGDSVEIIGMDINKTLAVAGLVGVSTYGSQAVVNKWIKKSDMYKNLSDKYGDIYVKMIDSLVTSGVLMGLIVANFGKDTLTFSNVQRSVLFSIPVVGITSFALDLSKEEYNTLPW
jgi:hypothetical protein